MQYENGSPVSFSSHYATPIEDVDIRDDFMFAYVIRNEEICIELLKYLLPGHQINRVEYYELDENGQEVLRPEQPPRDVRLETQKAIAEAFNRRGVRLDAYLDDGKTIYNIEMQTTRLPALPQRARLYQAQLDINQLQRGQQYDELRPTFIIFICTFDPFGRGQYRYSFRNMCEEAPGLVLADGAHKLFFSTVGTKGEISDELRQVLTYINNPPAAVAEGIRLPLLQKIDEVVGEAKMDDEWRRNYMTYQIHQRDAELIGRMGGIQDVAQHMLQDGMREDIVARYTGLSLQDVRSLRHKPPVTPPPSAGTP